MARNLPWQELQWQETYNGKKLTIDINERPFQKYLNESNYMDCDICIFLFEYFDFFDFECDWYWNI